MLLLAKANRVLDSDSDVSDADVNPKVQEEMVEDTPSDDNAEAPAAKPKAVSK